MKKNYCAVLILLVSIMLVACGKQDDSVINVENFPQKEALPQVMEHETTNAALSQESEEEEVLQTEMEEVSQESIEGVVIPVDESSENVTVEQNEESTLEQVQTSVNTPSAESGEGETGGTPAISIDTPTQKPTAETPEKLPENPTVEQPKEPSKDPVNEPTNEPVEVPKEELPKLPSDEETIELPFVPAN